MNKTVIELKNEAGLHARPASMFVKEASKYASIIKVIKDEQEFNGKSIMSILSMGAGKGSRITIVAEGEDEAKAVEALKNLVQNNFDE